MGGVFSCTDRIMSQFLPVVVLELPKFFLLFGDFTPNFASKLETRSKPLRPPNMEVSLFPPGIGLRLRLKLFHFGRNSKDFQSEAGSYSDRVLELE